MSLTSFIKKYVRDYSKHTSIETEWNEPLVAYANAKDPLFLKLKEIVHHTHLMPADLIHDAETVVTFFIPFHKEIPKSNSLGERPSREWAISYIETNKLIIDLNASIKTMLTESGYTSAVIPPTHNFDEELLISSWSHKHIGFIAGLGTFGLHRLLITEKGCCGRLGSIVTNQKIISTSRPQTEFCLYNYNRTCKKCIVKCVNASLQIDSFHRVSCYDVCLKNAGMFSDLGLADVCGKCACVVPCSFKNPVE